MVNCQAIRLCVGTGAGFVGLRGGVECDRQRGVLREGAACLCWGEPFWLRVSTDEIEIGVGGVRFRFAGWRLLRLEMMENPPATEIIHVVP